MVNTTWMLIFPFITILLVLAVPIVIGVLVYKDAKLRGMDPVVWALIAALAPSLIGLIIYLVVCSSHKRLTCNRCGYEVNQAYNVCPNCGAPLKYRCETCGAPVEEGWKVCAQCGEAVKPGRAPAVSYTKGKPVDRRIWIAIVLMILIPLVVVLLLAVLGMAGYLDGGASVSAGARMIAFLLK